MPPEISFVAADFLEMILEVTFSVAYIQDATFEMLFVVSEVLVVSKS